MKKLVLFLVTVLIFSCATIKENPETPPEYETEEIVSTESLTADQLLFPSLMNVNKTEFEADSLVNGVVEDISIDELGLMKIVISTTINYYFLDGIKSVEYKLFYGGMIESYVEVGKEINRGDLLGKASPESYLTSYCDYLNNYMVRMSHNIPVFYNDNWYFSPNWLLGGYTTWLTFRPVDNLETALIGYYNRWIVEREPDTDNLEDNELFYNNDFDRIRFKINLKTYPEAAIRDKTILDLEDSFYNGAEVFVLESLYDDITIKGYNVKIYWQNGFDQYLMDEYQLGDDLYVYGSIYGIDHLEKEVIIGVRDFALQSDEDIVEEIIRDNNLK